MAKLVLRHLRKHPIRSLLTIGSLTVALFLLCFLRSVLTTLESGIDAANSRRLWVQSAVSLYVNLPTSYENKIEQVEGVAKTCKWQWFGGYYQERSNFFAQFAVEPRKLLDIWPEIEIVEGSADAFLGDRASCLVGEGLARDYGWEIGQTIPIIGALFPKPDGSAWEFTLAGVYRPTRPTIDNNTFFFHWKRFEKTMEAIDGQPPDVGVFVIEVAPGADPTSVMAAVDGLFENGPQRVQTTTEAEFSRQFVSMLGNVPRLVGFISAGVFFAILLAVVNTMLMSAREQMHDVGILKALGFTDGATGRLLLLQSLSMCTFGGGLGIVLALATAHPLAAAMGRMFPGYAVEPRTIVEAAVVAVGVGLLAGLVPAWNARRLKSVDALRPH